MNEYLHLKTILRLCLRKSTQSTRTVLECIHFQAILRLCLGILAHFPKTALDYCSDNALITNRTTLQDHQYYDVSTVQSIVAMDKMANVQLEVTSLPEVCGASFLQTRSISLTLISAETSSRSVQPELSSYLISILQPQPHHSQAMLISPLV